MLRFLAVIRAPRAAPLAARTRLPPLPRRGAQNVSCGMRYAALLPPLALVLTRERQSSRSLSPSHLSALTAKLRGNAGLVSVLYV